MIVALTTEEDHLREIGVSTLNEICEKYLTNEEHDLVYLLVNGRRNKEIAIILDLPPCEVIRLKKNIIRKIKTIYKYHYKLNYFDFFRFASLILNKKQILYLIRYYRDFKRLREIAKEFKTQTSNIHRQLRTIASKLDKSVDPDSPLREFFGCFHDLPYLNIQEIRRTKLENQQNEQIQIGENNLGERIGTKVRSYRPRTSNVKRRAS